MFWYHYTQSFKEIILKDQYIPALKYREIISNKTSKKTASKNFEIYASWEIISRKYTELVAQYTDYIPLVCTVGSVSINERIEFYSKDSLLKHFSECLLHDIVTHTPSTAKFDQQIKYTLIYHCFSADSNQPRTSNQALEEYQQWSIWKEKLTRSSSASNFDLGFQLQEANTQTDKWKIHFVITAKQDPSFKVFLSEYWQLNQKDKTTLQKQLGKDVETHLLLNLGYAAKIYPKLWQGLETDQPTGLQLNLIEAFEFLKESAWILEDAGYKVIVPAWWTPEGRRRSKLRLKTSSGSPKKATNNKEYFSLDILIEYQYQLSIGGQVVTPKEWEQLVNTKTLLIQFRGQWMELEPEKMQQMLDFWRTHAEEAPTMTLIELVKLVAESEDDLEFEHEQVLSSMISKLQDKSKLQLVENSSLLKGNLRDYQKRGVSWLQYLENLVLNGCLADDMGLGKSVQVIARLVNEKAEKDSPLPTLLIAPTSVIGNWQKEIEKFAPHLQTMVHHGSKRIQERDEFKAACSEHDVVITSFTLVKKDEKLLASVKWQRIIIDEAQNIKNPKAAQTRAILKLEAPHKLALTGTPVENRLLDLWSIFNFLNPGYLGKEAQFRKLFEIPIQKEQELRSWINQVDWNQGGQQDRNCASSTVSRTHPAR